MPITTTVDNLITRVSMQGVSQVTGGQKLVGAGFRALRGDIRAAKSELMGLDLGASMAVVGVGAGMATASGMLTRNMTTATIRMDSLRRSMDTATGSAAETEREFERLRESARRPGLGFEQAIEGSVRLQSAGLSADLARRSLEEFGNALASVGKGKAELDGVNLALSQIAAKGKVSAEEINQIAERVPQIRTVMKNAFGTANTEELQRMGIDSQTFITRIVEAMAKLPRAAGGLQNSIDNLDDSWKQFLQGSGAGTAGVISTAAGAATFALDAFNGLNTATHGVAGGFVLAGTALTFLAGTTLMMAPGIKVVVEAWRAKKQATDEGAASDEKAAVAATEAGTASKTLGASTITGSKGMEALAVKTALATKELNAFTVAALEAAAAGRAAGGSSVPVPMGTPKGGGPTPVPTPIPTPTAKQAPRVPKTAPTQSVPTPIEAPVPTPAPSTPPIAPTVGVGGGAAGVGVWAWLRNKVRITRATPTPKAPPVGSDTLYSLKLPRGASARNIADTIARGLRIRDYDTVRQMEREAETVGKSIPKLKVSLPKIKLPTKLPAIAGGIVLTKALQAYFAYSTTQWLGDMATAGAKRRYEESGGKQSRLAYSLGKGITDVLSGAAAGGAVFGAPGAAAGAIISIPLSLYGTYNQYGRQTPEPKPTTDQEQAVAPSGWTRTGAGAWTPGNNPGLAPSSSNQGLEALVKYLQQIANNTGDTNRLMVGGGNRTQRAYNQGDIQRAVMRTMAGQVS
jgi:tape measure domain-containing protein